jgi:hypothetical protein
MQPERMTTAIARLLGDGYSRTTSYPQEFASSIHLMIGKAALVTAMPATNANGTGHFPILVIRVVGSDPAGLTPWHDRSAGVPRCVE